MSKRLAELAEAEYGTAICAMHFLQTALSSLRYDREAAHEFLTASRGQSGESWSERSLAVLFLENQLLRLQPDDLKEFDYLLVALGLKPQAGVEIDVSASVQREGFSTLRMRGFVIELIRRLRRLDRVHQPLLEGTCDEVAWGYFLRTARDPSKLTLARYVFTVDEVFQEITRKLLVTEGVEHTLSRIGEQPATSWTKAPLEAPEFEIELLRKLCFGRKIYWVSERCGSDLNALVEYPLTAAVLVIKPPGSDLEIEIKRAGTRGPRLLDVITERNGKDAPASHRLWGASLGWLAERETAAAGIFSKVYRLVHGADAPCSRGIANSSIVTIPNRDGQTHILDYLTDPQRFGVGFEKTREAMRACVASFPSDTGVARAAYRGEPGLTLQFIGQALPQQVIIFGSSSFRLDRIAAYLAGNGPEEYFRTGLGCGYTLRDVRWLADTVLEEILGEVVPPPEGYQEYSQYVRDTFRVSVNRERADQNYLSVMQQIGECWGTLLAVRGFSDGESFVQRNVGLKSVWKNGRFETRVIFMDHDDLTVAGARYRHLWPWREVSGMERDLVHILGGPMGKETIPGEVGVLKNIYRVSSDLGDAGLKLLEEAMCAAYRRTQSQLATNQELRSLFYPNFLDGYRVFDELVPSLLETDPREAESWKLGAAEFLRTKQTDEELITEYTKTICHFRTFFERMSFLYSK